MRYVCFHCGMHFTDEKQCLECKWLVCSHCGGCLCGLSEEGKRVAEAMDAQMRINFDLPIGSRIPE